MNIPIIKPENSAELIIIVLEQIKIYGNDGDLNHIDVSNVTDMTGIFSDSEFNGDISQWDVSNVKDMFGMFMSSQFNGDISKWNVSKVTNMCWMFKDSKFNGDLSNWDVSNVEVMNEMFENSQFAGDLSNWQPYKAAIYNMFINCHANLQCPYWSEYRSVIDRTEMIERYQEKKLLIETLKESLPARTETPKVKI